MLLHKSQVFWNNSHLITIFMFCINLKILENTLLFLLIICAEENYLKAIDKVQYFNGHHKLINSTIYNHRGHLNSTESILAPLMNKTIDNKLKEPTQTSSKNMNWWSEKKGKISFITLLIIEFKVQMEYSQK